MFQASALAPDQVAPESPGIRRHPPVGLGAPPADFTIDSLTAQRYGDQPVVLAQVRNTGRRTLRLSGELRLSRGPQGMSAGPFDARPGTTLTPGGTGSVTVSINEQVPNGPWKARVRLRSGSLKRSGEATILFPHAVSAASTETTETGFPPMALAAGLALLTAGLAVALVLLTHSRP